jgi:Phage tail assembly chaperone protein
MPKINEGKLLEAKLEEIREKRSKLFLECDYLFLNDITISPTTKSKAKAYRQALRDITKGIITLEQVENLVWPIREGF